MRHNDIQYGIPETLYRDTKTNIESISNPNEGMIAFATDTGTLGVYDGSRWVWGSGSSPTSFLELTDVNESTYAGKDGYAVVVEDEGLVFSEMDGNPNKISLYTSGVLQELYESSEDGLDEALTNATSGDSILVPPCYISGDHTIPESVTVTGYTRADTIFTGQITMKNGSTLANLSIIRTAGDGSDLKCVVVSDSGALASLLDVHLFSAQNGDGTARGISVEGDANVQIRNSFLHTSGSTAYAVFISDTGNAQVGARFCLINGPTPCNDPLRFFTYACQFDSGASTFGTPAVGDRAAYNHTHEPGSEFMVAPGGINMGGTSDPGTANLIVDGAVLFTALVGVGMAPVMKLDVAGQMRYNSTALVTEVGISFTAFPDTTTTYDIDVEAVMGSENKVYSAMVLIGWYGNDMTHAGSALFTIGAYSSHGDPACCRITEIAEDAGDASACTLTAPADKILRISLTNPNTTQPKYVRGWIRIAS
jgi:hypothetical protein